MKKALVVIPLFLILLVALLAGIGFALPKEYEVQRSMQIEAEPAEVYAMVSDLEKWPEWVYWTTDRVDDLEVTFGDITKGTGASQTWKEKHGEGKLTLTNCVENKEVTMEMQFDEFPPMSSTIAITTESLEETDPNTKEVTKREVTVVTWTASGKLGDDPMSAWFGLVMRPMIGRDYDFGLARLKENLEADEDPAEQPADADNGSNQDPPS